MTNLATPRVTVDPVVLTYLDGQLSILLVKRMTEPEKGAWAIPGGHVLQNEVMMTAIERSLQQKASVSIRSLDYIDQLFAFDTVGLDPRGHAITIAFLCLSNHATIRRSNLDSQPQFFDINNLPDLAFDHISIVRKAKERLAELSVKTTIASKLMPDVFGLSQLHQYYQIILGKKLDRRNFRKKFLALGVLVDTGIREEKVPNRPGHLYKFKTKHVSDFASPLE